MVDFNTEATMSTPVSDIVKILILEARENVLTAIERLNKAQQENQELTSEYAVVRARTFTFFLQMRPMLKRRLSEKEFKSVTEKVNSTKESDILEVFDYMSDYLDNLGLLRIDLQRYYDTTRIKGGKK